MAIIVLWLVAVFVFGVLGVASSPEPWIDALEFMVGMPLAFCMGFYAKAEWDRMK